jgi:hypothetical protein
VDSLIIVKGDYINKEYRIDNFGLAPGVKDERQIKIDFQAKGYYEISLGFEEVLDGGLKDHVIVDAEYDGKKLIDQVLLKDVFGLPKVCYAHEHGVDERSLVLTICYSMPAHLGDGMTSEEQQEIMNSYADFNMILTLKRV